MAKGHVITPIMVSVDQVSVLFSSWFSVSGGKVEIICLAFLWIEALKTKQKNPFPNLPAIEQTEQHWPAGIIPSNDSCVPQLPGGWLEISSVSVLLSPSQRGHPGVTNRGNLVCYRSGTPVCVSACVSQKDIFSQNTFPGLETGMKKKTRRAEQREDNLLNLNEMSLGGLKLMRITLAPTTGNTE